MSYHLVMRRIQMLWVGWAVFSTVISAVLLNALMLSLPESSPHPSLFAMLLFGFFVRKAIVGTDQTPDMSEKYRILFELSPMGIVLLDGRGVIREANPVVLLFFNLTAGQLRGGTFDHFLVEGHKLPNPSEGLSKGEIVIKSETGRRKWLTAHVNELDTEGDRLRYVILEDITERKQAEEEIMHLLYHDPLTGLGNRLLFQDSLSRLCSPPEPGGENDAGGEPSTAAFALLLMDLDRFKEVNDVFGHQAGDELLQEVGAGIRRQTPEYAVPCRIGGDEFAILLPIEGMEEEAERLADSLLRIVAATVADAATEQPVTVSIGIAMWPDHAEQSESLMRAADIAMYRAKQEGRNRCRLFHPDMTHAAGDWKI